MTLPWCEFDKKVDVIIICLLLLKTHPHGIHSFHCAKIKLDCYIALLSFGDLAQTATHALIFIAFVLEVFNTQHLIQSGVILWAAASAANTLRTSFSFSSVLAVQAALSFFNISLWILHLLNANALKVLSSHAVPLPVIWNLALWEDTLASSLYSSSESSTIMVWELLFFQYTFKFLQLKPMVETANWMRCDPHPLSFDIQYMFRIGALILSVEKPSAYAALYQLVVSPCILNTKSPTTIEVFCLQVIRQRPCVTFGLSVERVQATWYSFYIKK